MIAEPCECLLQHFAKSVNSRVKRSTNSNQTTIWIRKKRGGKKGRKMVALPLLRKKLSVEFSRFAFKVYKFILKLIQTFIHIHSKSWALNLVVLLLKFKNSFLKLIQRFNHMHLKSSALNLVVLLLKFTNSFLNWFKDSFTFTQKVKSWI